MTGNDSRGATPFSVRRHELDWFRVLLFALLVPFHVAVGFVDTGLNSYRFVNDDLAGNGMLLFLYWSHSWRLPSLFLISGIGTWLLTARGVGFDFMCKRLMRLLVPFVFASAFINVFGGFVIAFMVADDFSAGAFLGQWFTQPQPWQIMHLWFLLNLALYTIVCWPLFALRDRILAKLPNPLVLLFCLTVVSALVMVLLKPYAASVRGQNFNLVFYFVFFFGGYLIGADHERILNFAKRYALWLLAAAGVVFLCQTLLLLIAMREDMAASVALRSGGWLAVDLNPANAALYSAVEALTAWSWCLAALGLTCRYLTRPSATLSALNGAVYPLYVLHFPVTLVCLALVAQVPGPWWTEYPLVVILVYAITLGLWGIFSRLGPLAYLVGGKAGARAQTSSQTAIR